MGAPACSAGFVPRPPPPSATLECPPDALVWALCASHVGLWGCVVVRNRGGARALLAALLALHTHAWWRALREGQAFRGYRAACGRTYEWPSVRLGGEVLEAGGTWDSPDLVAAGETWYLRLSPNVSVEGERYLAAHLARRPLTRRRAPPPLVEVSLQLGGYLSAPRLSRFEEWPYIEGRGRFLSHARLASMLEESPTLAPRVWMLDVCTCLGDAQLGAAALEAALLLWVVLLPKDVGLALPGRR